MTRKIDPKILALAKKIRNKKVPMIFFKRFLDEYISMWNGTSKDLHKFYQEINQSYPNIKFTMNTPPTN